jgi:SpoVK/Ycf46/Vps4 family AAA+-type ATPase
MGFYDEDDVESGAKKGMYKHSAVWMSSDGANYFPSNIENAAESLPPGEYTIDIDQMRGLYFVRHHTAFDEMIKLPDTVAEELVAYVDKFWTMEDKFKQFGYIWKRGILMYGPPGSGKTTTLQLTAQSLIAKGGIVLYADSPALLAVALGILRTIEPSRPIIVIIEDIDIVLEGSSNDNEKLTHILDGEYQVENIVFIATTNYIENLDSRLTNRPSRFDLVKHVGMPCAEARKVYIEEVLSRSNDSVDNIDEWVARTEGYSVAHIKELIISVRLFDTPFEEAVSTLDELMNADYGYVNDDDGDDDDDDDSCKVYPAVQSATEIIAKHG